MKREVMQNERTAAAAPVRQSIVTLILTATFSALSLTGIISGEQFATIFTTVISFYFGTQYERKSENRISNE